MKLFKVISWAGFPALCIIRICNTFHSLGKYCTLSITLKSAVRNTTASFGGCFSTSCVMGLNPGFEQNTDGCSAKVCAFE